MTFYQWVTLGLGAAGFLITWTVMWFGAGRVVGQIRGEVSQEIATEKKDVIDKLEKLEKLFFDEQKTQDHNVGEMGAALRRHIENVHEKLREVEIWGRDNYAQKPEIESIRRDIKDLAQSIKDDFKDLHERIDRKPN